MAFFVKRRKLSHAEKEVFNEVTELELHYELQQVTLPTSLLRLDFISTTPLEKMVLPHSLRILTFGDQFNHSLDRVALPRELNTLWLGDGFNKPM